MKERKVYFFLGIFYLLFVCTVLSGSIQKQMTVKVKVLEPSFSEDLTRKEAYPIDVLSGGLLYEAGKGSKWDEGLKANVIPPEFYIEEEKQLFIPTNMEERPILYRSKELYPGADVQHATPYPKKEGFYLVISQGKAPRLLSVKEKEPFMENLEKTELNLSTEERLYSMAEVEEFSEAFVPIGTLVAFLLMTLILWIFGFKLIGKKEKNRGLILLSGGILCGLLFGIYKSAYAIALPSSLLSTENIFDIFYYRKEFEEVLGALRQIGSEEANSILETFYNHLWLGSLIVVMGIAIAFIFIICEIHISKKRKSNT